MSKKSNELITSKVQKMFHLHPKNAQFIYIFLKKKGLRHFAFTDT